MIITPYELFMIVQGNLDQGEVGVGAFIEIADDICNFILDEITLKFETLRHFTIGNDKF